jgi:hypothetical protein
MVRDRAKAREVSSMRRAVQVVIATAVLWPGLLTGASAAAAAGPAALGGAWGSAEGVPGTAALNQGGTGVIRSVSCGSAGNCGAGGDYTDSAGHLQAYVVTKAASP